MRSYLLIIGILIVAISVLVTLNIFFQQSLQLEIAEQFSNNQLQISTSIADSIKGYVQFMKEETIEVSRELAERDDKKIDINELVEEELKHKGMIKATVSILDTNGNISFLKGDRSKIEPLISEILTAGQNTEDGGVTILSNYSLISIVSPLYKRDKLQNMIVFSFGVRDIATQFLSNLKLSSGGYAWMMDKNGTLLYHPTQPGMVGGNIYKATSNCFGCHKDFDLEKRVIEGKARDFGRYIAPTGEDKILAFSTVNMDSISWIIAVAAPYSEVTRATGQSMKLYSYLIISIFAITSIVSAMLIVFNKKRIKAEEVAKRKEEIEKYALQLEEKVNERTAELVSEKEKLDTIVSAIGGGILLIDRGGVIQWANQMIKDMAGMDVTGKRCEDICPDCNLSSEYVKANDNIDTIILTNLFGHKDKHFQITTAPVKGENGEIHGYIRLIQDVTEIKKMEEQIIHSEKLASIGRLAAGIAHEIGNPLTSIFSFVQILREMEEDEFKKESLETIYFHINRISEILKQLSGFTKMPIGEPKERQINEIIDTSINLIQYDKKAKDINIVKDLSPSLPAINTDGNQLSQVFVNLILNAIDAMPDGGTLTVSSRLKEDNIIIQFKDTGIGIRQEELQKIFDPFYTTKEKGTGLGLAVSYNIIKKMNGSLTVESEFGKGTTFTIKLPLNTAETYET